MTGTFRVTFHEWEKYELIVPAETEAEAICITQMLRYGIGTDHPFVEIDGGTEHFEAYGPARSLTRDDIRELKQALRASLIIAQGDDEVEAVRLLARGLKRAARPRR